MCNKGKLKNITEDTVKAILSVSSEVEKIILFGSQARGDSNAESDIDILVVIDAPEEQLSKIKRAMRNLTSMISLEQDEVVSLIISDKKEYQDMADTLFYRNIARDGIELYGRAS
ncbi:MAG: nucleotidyltransferase domain-containing protein [Phascolarctobacterium sp.]|uniref:nucleotidyltransferase domain-containing protein n=1 Tax=Phascolarctobacterium sp. TaxID=2049039 RepID=UPI0026DB18CE|nr:nucleotidyltransferase domain-containing protein [Phascolarctobacterium sp.]MDO4920840.1 nucleotidyltransferase domain-containing protein [Phascolarctobacterium sp.]